MALGFLTDHDLTRMLGVHFATVAVAGGPSNLPGRLRELAASLLHLADAHERLALTSDQAPPLRAELGRAETVLRSLVEVSDQVSPARPPRVTERDTLWRGGPDRAHLSRL